MLRNLKPSWNVPKEWITRSRTKNISAGIHTDCPIGCLCQLLKNMCIYIYIYTLHGTITYPIWGKEKSSTQKCRLGQGDMLVPWRVYTYIASDKIGEVLWEFALLCSMQQHFISANIDTLLMAKILHQLIGVYPILPFFTRFDIHPRWCMISSIKSITRWIHLETF